MPIIAQGGHQDKALIVMVFLFTDFGYTGPYVGQMKAVIHQRAPDARVVDLMHDAPRFDPRAASYLLAALTPRIPPSSIAVAVVDPGVGSERQPVMLRADGRIFIGPANGLLDMVARRAKTTKTLALIPDLNADISSSFHGRDIFAPAAAQLANGETVSTKAAGPPEGIHWPDDLAEVIYIDTYGNAMTGLRATANAHASALEVGGMVLRKAETFSDVSPGEAFWYQNSIGLVEIAVNKGQAAADLRIQIGTPVAWT